MASDRTITKQDIAKYYDDTLPFYKLIWYKNSDSAGLHYGLWDGNTKSIEEAIRNENVFLAELADIKETDDVLDAGCGVGGSSIWIAENIGANVVGITLSEKQLKEAERLVEQRRVSNVKFHVMDYTKTSFPDNHFDVVWAIESVCHAEDKKDFIREVYRVLKPGGRAVIADGFLSREPLPDESRLYQNLLDGWVLPNLAITADFNKIMEDGGFKDVSYIDKTSDVKKSSDHINSLFHKFRFPLGVMKALHLLSNVMRTGLAAEAQYELMKNGLMVYGIFYGRK